MNRRQLLKLVALGGAGSILDIDRLLWVPNTKSFFLPSEVPWIHTPSISELIATEYLRITPRILELFHRDDIFYKVIHDGVDWVEQGKITIPMEIKKR